MPMISSGKLEYTMPFNLCIAEICFATSFCLSETREAICCEYDFTDANAKIVLVKGEKGVRSQHYLFHV
jgi:hypothetical protein